MTSVTEVVRLPCAPDRAASQLWWSLARAPLLAFALLAVPLAVTRWDLLIAQALYFDPATGWLGAHSILAGPILHTAGRWVIRGIILLTFVAWLASYMDARLAPWRRSAGYTVIAMVLCTGVVGALKLVTNVDCPWDLREFGGRFPFVHLFADRPDGLRAAHCFPAAHASSGYALFALYFVVRERSQRWAQYALLLGGGVGLMFGIAQQSRGAHFLSHDLWSAFLCWMMALTLYTQGFGARLRVDPAQ